MTLEPNQVYLGDCLEVMADIEDGSIDLTVTSPPYDNLRTCYDLLPFEKFQLIAQQLYRVTKSGGVVVWVVNDATINGSETGTSFRQALYFKECGFNLHDTMIWQKGGQGACGSIHCYLQDFEYMFVLSKARPKSLNLIYDRKNTGQGKMVSSPTRRRVDGGKNVNIKKLCAKFGKRFNVWILNNGDIKGDVHPATFPMKLARDHIISWSNEGDTVLDPFAGSATTLVAAANTGRNYIGIEKDPDYYELAKKRIDRETRQERLF